MGGKGLSGGMASLQTTVGDMINQKLHGHRVVPGNQVRGWSVGVFVSNCDAAWLLFRALVKIRVFWNARSVILMANSFVFCLASLKFLIWGLRLSWCFFFLFFFFLISDSELSKGGIRFKICVFSLYPAELMMPNQNVGSATV